MVFLRNLIWQSLPFDWNVYIYHCSLFLAVLSLSCGMRDLGPHQGLNPGPRALGAHSLSHWTTKEVPELFTFKSYILMWLSIWLNILLFSPSVFCLFSTPFPGFFWTAYFYDCTLSPLVITWWFILVVALGFIVHFFSWSQHPFQWYSHHSCGGP